MDIKKIPGLSLLAPDKPLAVESLLEVNGYASRAVYDWEIVRGKNNTDMITEFRTSWTVPPSPTIKSQQTVFLFNGMLPSALNVSYKAILQPVLQWGNVNIGGGAYWSVLSWYVILKETAPGKWAVNHVTRTEPIRVKPGRTVIGVITQEFDEKFGLFACTSRFEGIKGTELTIEIPDELVRNVIALEAYKLFDEKELPATEYSSFVDTILQTSKSRVKPTWALQNLIKDSNIQAKAVSHNEIEDQIDIYYR